MPRLFHMRKVRIESASGFLMVELLNMQLSQLLQKPGPG